jgi:V/A-type H+-transporting ATPase subunit D
MLANVHATRMELLGLRRRASIAVRGHYLLSEKRDEISRQLVKIASQLQPMRNRVEKQLRQIFQRFMFARASMEPEATKVALEIPTKKFSLLTKFATVMNVKIPELTKEMSGDIVCYGYATTSGELDAALLALEKAIDELIELAAKEKQASLLAAELQTTRRRVNVLEHIVIPEIRETIKFIFTKLSEAERDNTTRLMKIADIIRR